MKTFEQNTNASQLCSIPWLEQIENKILQAYLEEIEIEILVNDMVQQMSTQSIELAKTASV